MVNYLRCSVEKSHCESRDRLGVKIMSFPPPFPLSIHDISKLKTADLRSPSSLKKRAQLTTRVPLISKTTNILPLFELFMFSLFCDKTLIRFIFFWEEKRAKITIVKVIIYCVLWNIIFFLSPPRYYFLYIPKSFKFIQIPLRERSGMVINNSLLIVIDGFGIFLQQPRKKEELYARKKSFISKVFFIEIFFFPLYIWRHI